ncbi:HTTM domain-containing protein [Acidicapsa ligni]|uniref:HTTM domain-containing protein n=1 Tax=Acidicapsa ligni TaxID=542300 RepID=UPI0021E0B015|nr:HTTM domain-containing protein [Acidicapsa ligni]
MNKRSPSILADFFFKPISPYPLGLFRILFGFCVGATLLFLHRDWLAWFGVEGWVSMETIGKAESGFRLDLFPLIPRDDRWVVGLYWLLLAASIALTLGLATRLSTVIVYLGLNSLNQRNPLILHGGDTLLRAVAFFLVFAPAGAALSLDSVLRRRHASGPGAKGRLYPPWAQRLIQFQLAIVYLAGFCWKLKGAAWRNGTALFYVVHLREIARFPLPAFILQSWALHLGTWLALCFELVFPLLVWFKPFRTPLLIAGLLFHLSLEYALNIPMFQWDMLCVYPLFFDPGGLQRCLQFRVFASSGLHQAQD